MKKSFFIFALTMIFISCGQKIDESAEARTNDKNSHGESVGMENNVDPDDQNIINREIYETGEPKMVEYNKPDSQNRIKLEFYKTGELLSETFFDDGKDKENFVLSKKYYENGKVKEIIKISRKNTTEDKIMEEYSEKGKVTTKKISLTMGL
ncbi:MAG: hypothetical protein ACRCSK_03435 [Fusobacteriaceae bacterium]